MKFLKLMNSNINVLSEKKLLPKIEIIGWKVSLICVEIERLCFCWQRIYARPEVGVFTTVASATVLHHSTSPDFLEEVS